MKDGIVQIHGREYKTVALRVSEFRNEFPISDGWSIRTKIKTDDGTTVIVKATIQDPNGKVVATGIAEERRGATQINKTSALENCETSAIGRALAASGFGGSEYASANEVENAVGQQNSPPAQKDPEEVAAEAAEAFDGQIIEDEPRTDDQLEGMMEYVKKIGDLPDEHGKVLDTATVAEWASNGRTNLLSELFKTEATKALRALNISLQKREELAGDQLP